MTCLIKTKRFRAETFLTNAKYYSNYFKKSCFKFVLGSTYFYLWFLPINQRYLLKSCHQKRSARSHSQIIAWKTLDTSVLDPSLWGWMKVNDQFTPINSDYPPAPDRLPNFVRCNCNTTSKNACPGNMRSCRKYGLHCMSSQRDLGPNLKKKGIKLKFSGEVHFYLRNNILNFHRDSKGGTPLFLPLKSRDLFPNNQNISLPN